MPLEQIQINILRNKQIYSLLQFQWLTHCILLFITSLLITLHLVFDDDMGAAVVLFSFAETLDFCTPTLLPTTFEPSALEKWLLTLVLELVETREEKDDLGKIS